MANLRKLYGVDSTRVDEGAIMALPEGASLVVRSQSSHKVRDYAAKQQKKHRHIYASGRTLSAEQIDEDQVDLLANVVVVSWSGIEDDDGKPLPFSKKAVRELMTELPDLRNLVLAFSLDIENYKSADMRSPAEVQEAGKD
jgi:hypothetical protein